MSELERRVKIKKFLKIETKLFILVTNFAPTNYIFAKMREILRVKKYPV
jgi:hypothetical protein